MAISMMAIQPISRSAGRSAAASAAYRSGESIYDERQDRVFKYDREDDVIATECYANGLTRQQLWHDVEMHHKRKDATTAYEIMVALPHELDEQDRVSLAKNYAEHLHDRFGVGVDIAVHRSQGEGENWHAHIMLTSATLNDKTLGPKQEKLNPHWCQLHNEPNPAEYMRSSWSFLANCYGRGKGLELGLDLRSYERQGVDKVPMVHVGPMRGLDYTDGQKEILAENEAIREANEHIAVLAQAIRILEQIEQVTEPEQQPIAQPEPDYAQGLDDLLEKLNERTGSKSIGTGKDHGQGNFSFEPHAGAGEGDGAFGSESDLTSSLSIIDRELNQKRIERNRKLGLEPKADQPVPQPVGNDSARTQDQQRRDEGNRGRGSTISAEEAKRIEQELRARALAEERKKLGGNEQENKPRDRGISR